MIVNQEIHKNASIIHCYKCGSPRVLHVCHHCALPMCSSHVFAGIDKKGNLLSSEFTKLKLSKECGQEAFHCEKCFHTIRDQTVKPIIVGVIIILLSLILVSSNQLKIFCILSGVGLIGYGFYINKKNRVNLTRKKPALPVIPGFNKLQIKETVTGSINLSPDGLYSVSKSPVLGQINISMTLSELDRDRLKAYTKKYGLARNYCAGFLALEGLAAFQLENSYRHLNRIIPLIDTIDSQPLLMGEDQKDSEKKDLYLSYSLLDEIPDKAFPIQITICFLPESNQQGIELEIQWIRPASLNLELWETLWKLEINQIESFKLQYPVSWGQVERIDPSSGAVVGLDNQTITWNKLKISKLESSCIFKIEFENQIDPVNSFVNGTIKALFTGTLSGLSNIGIFFPTGKRFNLEKKDFIDKKTQLNVDFEINLSSIQYQKFKEIPDDENNVTLFVNNVSPNYVTITTLVNIISRQGFYVKQLIENQHTTITTKAETRKINHIWSISGRWYDGVYPIEFRIDLRGEEEINYNNQFLGGSTEIKLIVKGYYSNFEMESKIIDVWNRLYNLSRETLESLAISSSYQDQSLLMPSVEDQSSFVVMDAELVDTHDYPSDDSNNDNDYTESDESS